MKKWEKAICAISIALALVAVIFMALLVIRPGLFEDIGHKDQLKFGSAAAALLFLNICYYFKNKRQLSFSCCLCLVIALAALIISFV